VKEFRCWRYKCDYCGKNGHGKHAMREHEKGCTMNPSRICRFHKVVTGEEFCVVPTIAEMLDLLKAHQGDSDHGLKALRELVDNCPTCILAALRQSGLCSYHGKGEDYCPPLIGTEEFDYEKEHASVWADVNQAKAEANAHDRRKAKEFSALHRVDGG